MSKLDYAKLHGGKKAPRGLVEYKQWYGPSKIIGEIEKISYRADKGSGMQTYQHQFSKHDGRGPHLLRGVEGEAESQTDVRLENPSETQAELGPIVDIVLTNGKRVIIGDAILAASQSGDELVIESEAGVPFQIEKRPGGHFVTERGIEE